jgi:hypothetical protein
MPYASIVWLSSQFSTDKELTSAADGMGNTLQLRLIFPDILLLQVQHWLSAQGINFIPLRDELCTNQLNEDRSHKGDFANIPVYFKRSLERPGFILFCL